MSIKLLREIFTANAPPGYVASDIQLGYVRPQGTEMQQIRISGTSPDGSPFDIVSDPHKPDFPLTLAVKALIAKLPEGSKP